MIHQVENYTEIGQNKNKEKLSKDSSESFFFV